VALFSIEDGLLQLELRRAFKNSNWSLLLDHFSLPVEAVIQVVMLLKKIAFGDSFCSFKRGMLRVLKTSRVTN